MSLNRVLATTKCQLKSASKKWASLAHFFEPPGHPSGPPALFNMSMRQKPSLSAEKTRDVGTESLLHSGFEKLCG
eukprot:4268750-Amphidinium_carterae.1